MRIERGKISIARSVSVLLAVLQLALTACSASPAFLREGQPAAPSQDSAVYYPLAVGNSWEHETRVHDGGERARQSTTVIARQEDLGDGKTQYYMEGGKEFLLATRDGLFTPEGVHLLRFPVTLGDTWATGRVNYDQRRFHVASVTATLTAGGQRYVNCLHVEAASGFYASLMPGTKKMDRQAIEVSYYYAPHVGPVVTEVRLVKESGEKELVSRTELIRFQARSVAKTSRLPETATHSLVVPSQAFRFPKKGFFHPMMSPDERWLLYQRDDTMWKELYFTIPGKTDEHLVPLTRSDEGGVIRRFGIGKWSPDGRFFAVRVETEKGGRLVLVDFSQERPFVLESVESVAAGHPDDLFWTSDGYVVYVHSGARNAIMKKRPGLPAEEGVRSAGTDRMRVLQVAPTGTILYVGSPPHESLSYGSLSRSSVTGVFSVLRITNFDLAPDGKHAILYHAPDPGKWERFADLVNLETRELKRSWPLGTSHEFYARWSPDGRMLAFLYRQPFESSQTIPARPVANPHFRVLDLHSGAERDYGLGVSREFYWTPGGQHILYSMKHRHESLGIFTNGIFLMRLRDGNELGQLTKINAIGRLGVSLSGRFVYWQAANMDTFFVLENPFRSEMNE